MQNYFMLISTVLVLIITKSCNLSDNKNERSPYIPEGYNLTFHDEFESLVLDTAGNGSENWAPWWVGWNSRYLKGNNEKAWKCDSSYRGMGDEVLGIPLHEITAENTLKLYGKVTPQDKKYIVNNKPFIGGMISSNMSHAQHYGYFEIRARFKISKGHHWGIWMVPVDNSWPPEIDIVEVVGHQPDLAFMNGHWREDGEHKSDMIIIEDVNTAAFHTYGFEWTADSMFWYFDGKKEKEMANLTDKPMYIMVSPEIGGDWPGMPDSTTVWPMLCEIDYIRMYQY